MGNDYEILNDPEMKEIFDSFIIETKEILEKLDTDLVELEKRSDDMDLLNAIFRAFHTVKGTSGFLSLNKLNRVCHRAEDILNKLRKGELKVTEEIMDAILNAYDKMGELLTCIETNKNEDVDVEGTINFLTSILNKEASEQTQKEVVVEKTPEIKAKQEPQKDKVKEKEKPKEKEKSKEKAEEKTSKTKEIGKKKVQKKAKVQKEKKQKTKVIEETPQIKEEEIEEPQVLDENLVEEVYDTEKSDEIQDEDQLEKLEELSEKSRVESAPVSEQKLSVTSDQQKSESQTQTTLDGKPKTTTTTAQQTVVKGENTIRVDVERLDDLLNLVSELVLGRNRLAQISSEVQIDYEGTRLARELGEASKQIDLMTTELQLAVMKTRMIKIGKVFNKFPRLIRDLSREFKKDIELEIHGEDTELDKTVVEEINDPLVHLIRNSIDHGIEPKDIRIQKGKNPKGTIKLTAQQEGNNIVITVEDDGKGIDPEVIRNKAIEKGLVNKDIANEMPDKDVLNFIFLPGFSTAEKVTSVSGRGVGMDVVKTNVTKLRGIINIESEKGVGTKMIIKLPLTLAIIQGLLVEVNHETLIIPLYSVVEVVRVSRSEIYTVNKQEVIRVRDSVLPLLRIDRVLYKTKSDKREDDWHYVVVLGLAERRIGVIVDRLVGQKEVVIKSLGNFLGNVPGIAGSTIMGDGRVVMILDIVDLINHSVKENG